jgi:serine/threonine protein kinase
MDAEALKWTTLETSTQFGGTVRWVAPEILEGDQETTPVTSTSDIWSFGAVLYEVNGAVWLDIHTLIICCSISEGFNRSSSIL